MLSSIIIGSYCSVHGVSSIFIHSFMPPIVVVIEYLSESVFDLAVSCSFTKRRQVNHAAPHIFAVACIPSSALSSYYQNFHFILYDLFRLLCSSTPIMPIKAVWYYSALVSLAIWWVGVSLHFTSYLYSFCLDSPSMYFNRFLNLYSSNLTITFW